MATAMEVGATIGTYRVLKKIGEGGMGTVYVGEHTLLGRRAAIKVLLPMLSSNADIVKRFFNEARAVTLIADPGIVQVFDFGYHTDGSAFIVMEYLEGEPLDRRLARLGRLPVFEALRLCRQVAGSLAAAHGQRIVHRDLKPENIFLVHDAEVASGERCKILDFGIAKLSDEHPGKLKTHTGVLMGTPVYMSPEQCRGLAEVDHRSDIYSLGCVLFHLLTGRPPFEGEGPGDIIAAHIREPAPAPSSRAPDIAPNVDALVLRCLAKAPAERYQTMTELSAATALLVSYAPIVAPAPGSHMFPTTRVPLGGAQATSISFEQRLVTPTTLGSSTGQLTATPLRQRRTMLWIAGGLVVAAAAVGIAVVGSSGSVAPVIASRSTTSGTAGNESSSLRSMNDALPDKDARSNEPPRVSPDAAVPVDATTTDAAVTEDLKVDEPPARTPGSPRRKHPTTDPKPSTPVVKSLNSSSKPQSTKCGKAVFAAIYNAEAPSKDAVSAGLRMLNTCHASGDISDAEFEQTQSALVARF